MADPEETAQRIERGEGHFAAFQHRAALRRIVAQRSHRLDQTVAINSQRNLTHPIDRLDQHIAERSLCRIDHAVIGRIFRCRCSHRSSVPDRRIFRCSCITP